MANHNTGYLPLSRVWTFASSAYSSSAYSAEPICGIISPAMEATTTGVQIEYSDSPAETVDASATWVPLTEEGTAVEFVVSTAASRDESPSPRFRLWRTRLKAVDSGGSAVAQVAQIVKPVRQEI